MNMQHRVRQIVVVLLLISPWLWPLTFGPYAEAMPWFFSLGVAALLLALWPQGEVTRLLALAWVWAATLSVLPEMLQYFGLARLEFFWPWIRDTAPGYASGNIGQPNQQATLLGMGLWASCWLIRSQGRFWAFGVAGAIIAVGMAATASRIGTVHLVAVLLLILLWGGQDRRCMLQWYAVVLAFYLAGALALPLLASQVGIEDARSLWIRIQNGEGSCGSRRLLWGNVLELIAAKPWLGWGWGDLRYAQYMTLFKGPRWCAVLGNAHNLPLHLAVTLGVPAALFFCTLVALVVLRERPWRERDSRRQLAWGVLVLFALHSLVEFPLWYGPFQIAAVACIYVLWKTRNSEGWACVAPTKRGEVLRYGAAAAMLGASIFGFSDYWRVSQPYLPPEHRVEGLRGNHDGQKTLVYASKTVLFQNQALFARLNALTVDNDNALVVNQLATYLLHFSPEPRVLEKLLDSAFFLNEMEQARFHSVRFRAAYPKEYSAWVKSRFPSGGWDVTSH